MPNIRRAQEDDCQAIRNVHVAAVMGISTDKYTPGEIQAWARPRKAESYEESIRNKEFLVAEEVGVIVGFGVLNPESAEIEAVYVSPEAGRRGIGLEVLRRLEERAGVLGLGVLRLNASLNAVPFYENAGYVAQERSKYRLHTGVEIACIPMVKTMAPASVWEKIREHLETEKHRVNEEIKNYPTPIPACDAQFNYLLEERNRIAQELDELKALAGEGITRGEYLKRIDEFIASSNYIKGEVEQGIRSSLLNVNGGA